MYRFKVTIFDRITKRDEDVRFKSANWATVVNDAIKVVVSYGDMINGNCYENQFEIKAITWEGEE